MTPPPDMPDWAQALRKKLQQPLPGKAAQLRMAVYDGRLDVGWDERHPPRQAAVLILLRHTQESLLLPLIQRPDYPGVHGGQISLPGGKADPHDPNLAHTALRECQEELGIRISPAQVLGQLTQLYIPPSHMLVTPVLAYTPASELHYQPDPTEVAEVFEVSLSALSDPAHQTRWSVRSRQQELQVPAFRLQGRTIWGATAMMLSELLALWEQM